MLEEHLVSMEPDDGLRNTGTADEARLHLCPDRTGSCPQEGQLPAQSMLKLNQNMFAVPPDGMV